MQRDLCYEDPLVVCQWGEGREELRFLRRATGTRAPLQAGKCQADRTSQSSAGIFRLCAWGKIWPQSACSTHIQYAG